MKFTALIFISLPFLSPLAPAQEHSAGGGATPLSQCILPHELQIVHTQVDRAVSSLRRENSAAVVKYFDPMGNGGIDSFGKTITGYVDLDATAGIKDFNCGAITYDGHQGTDIELVNFYEMDEGVPIKCAAPGTVVYAHDGEFDRQTVWIDTVNANAVIVHHADGSDAWYWHMRKNSVRVKVGDAVKVGDTLGLVGSSGFSSGPHLHFQVQQGTAADPFSGACQPDSSRWVVQPAYVLTLPFQVMDHGVTTIPLNWATVCEKPPAKTHVKAGAKVYSWFRLRNIVAADLMKWEFYNGSTLYTSFSFAVDQTYSSSWWYGTLTMPVGVTYYGPWTVKVYRGGAQILTDSFVYDENNNQLPVLNDTTISVSKGGSKNGTFSGVDPDGSIFWYKVTSLPKNGIITQSGGRGRNFTYTPNASFVGKDTLLVCAFDDENTNGPNARYIFDVSTTPQDVRAADRSVPGEFSLSQNYPNPFNPSTTIEFTIPKNGMASLKVYDVLGREVATLVNGDIKGGMVHRVVFDASGYSGGLYFARLQFMDGVQTTKILLMK